MWQEKTMGKERLSTGSVYDLDPMGQIEPFFHGKIVIGFLGIGTGTHGYGDSASFYDLGSQDLCPSADTGDIPIVPFVKGNVGDG